MESYLFVENLSKICRLIFENEGEWKKIVNIEKSLLEINWIISLKAVCTPFAHVFVTF